MVKGFTLLLLFLVAAHADVMPGRRLHHQLAVVGGGGGGSSNNIPSNIVQSVMFSSIKTDLLPVNSEYRMLLPEFTGASNTLNLFCQGAETTSFGMSPSDDQTNTWTLLTNRLDSVNSQHGLIFCATNIKANTRLIKLKNTSATTIQWVAGAVQEIYGVNGVDKTAGTNSTGSTLVSGPFTPTQTGDLLLEYSVSDSGTAGTYFAGNQANINWTLLPSDTSDNQGVQVGFYNSTASINPTMTASNSHGNITMAVAYKAAAFGTPRTNDMRPVHTLHQSFPGGGALTQWVNFSYVGNTLLAAASAGVSNYIVTNITDTAGNNWSEAPGGPNKNANVENTQWWIASNCLANATNVLRVMFKERTNISDGTILFFDIQNGSIAPFDKRTNAVGDATVVRNLTNPPAITPSQAGGLVFALEQHALNTTTNVLTTNGLRFLSTYYNGMPISGPQNLDQNGGWAFGHVTNLLNWTFVWQMMTNSGPDSTNRTFAADAISLKPAP